MLKFNCGYCEKKLGVPDNYSGKQVRCTQCRIAIVVPALPVAEPDPAPDVYTGETDSGDSDATWTDEMFSSQQDQFNYDQDEPVESATEKMCPSCAAHCGQDDLLCIECGYNFQSKKSLHINIHKSKVKVKRRGESQRSKRLINLSIGLVLIGCFIWGVLGLESHTQAAIGFWGGLVTLGIGRIWFMVVAYQESVLWGVCCLVLPFGEVLFFLTHLGDCWKPTMVYTLGAMLLLVTIFGFAGDFFDAGFELTEEQIVTLIQDEDYMFDVGCWSLDQQGIWDDYDHQYDGEFAGLLSNYRSGWMEPPTKRAELVKNEIQRVETLVAGWDDQTRRIELIAYDEYTNAETEEAIERIFD